MSNHYLRHVNKQTVASILAAVVIVAVAIASELDWSGLLVEGASTARDVRETPRVLQAPTIALPKPRPATQPANETKGYKQAEKVIRQERIAELYPEKLTPKPRAPQDCKHQKCIALTFDDGPGPHTERLLDYLKQHNAKATFFLLGLYVERHAQTVKRIIKEGHQIGNHTWHHHNLAKLPHSEIVVEIGSTNRIIWQVSGTVPQVLRPPYGATNQVVNNASTMPQILWSVDPRDWQDRDAAVITERIVSAATPGAIVLAHDVYPSTVDAMPAVLERLKALGYVFATTDELVGGGKPPVPGEYRRQP